MSELTFKGQVLLKIFNFLFSYLSFSVGNINFIFGSTATFAKLLINKGRIRTLSIFIKNSCKILSIFANF